MISTPSRHSEFIGRIRFFILFLAVAFSFGGFSFYAAVVVPIGGEVFDATTQGFVTRKVTHVINAATVATLLALGWEGIARLSTRNRRENAFFFGLLTALVVCLIALLVLHPRLDAMLDDRDFSVDDPDRFYRLHQAYLWISTVQWLATLGVIWLLCASDRPRSTNET